LKLRSSVAAPLVSAPRVFWLDLGGAWSFWMQASRAMRRQRTCTTFSVA
jgi:hypothetical protein